VIDGTFDLELHHGLEHDRFGAAVHLAKCATARGLEGHLRRVDAVRFTVVDNHFDANYRETDQSSLRHALHEALLDGWYVLCGDRTALDFAHELEIVVAVFHRLDPARDATELTGATCLLLVGVVEIGPLGDRLAIGDLGCARLDLATILALHPLDIDFEMKLAHARDHGFVALGIDA